MPVEFEQRCFMRQQAVLKIRDGSEAVGWWRRGKSDPTRWDRLTYYRQRNRLLSTGFRYCQGGK